MSTVRIEDWNPVDDFNFDLTEEMIEIGKLITEEARAACPVDTGTLRDSIEFTSDDKSASISANTNYASFVEYGTYKMAAQPYLRPAIENHQKEILELIAEGLLKKW